MTHSTCGNKIVPEPRQVISRPGDHVWPRDFMVTVPYCPACRVVVPLEELKP